MKLKQVDLFSGVGGFPLALREWCDLVALCEIEPEAIRVLSKRFPQVPVHPTQW